MKRLNLTMLWILMLCLLSACVRSDAAKELPSETAASVEEVTRAADGSLLIPLSYFDEGVRTIDLKSGDTDIQLLAHMGSDGQPKLSWNTCQVCNGSPYAYFELQNGQLICANCGNAFPVDSIGGASYGCYPWAVSEYTMDDEKVMFSADEIASMENSFKNWRKGL